MEQTNYALLALTQAMNQSSQTANTTKKSGQDDNFQGLLTKKSQETAPDRSATENNPNDKNVLQTKPDKQKDQGEEEDPLMTQLACAQMLIPEVVSVEVETQVIQEVVPAAVEEIPTAVVETAEQTPEVAEVVTTPDLQTEQPVQQTQAPEVEAATQQQPAAETVPVETQTEQTGDETSSGQELPAQAKDDEVHVEVTESPEAQAQPVFHDVEPVMIKVGEAPAAEDTEQVPDLEQQVMEPLTEALSRGETKVEIQLSPRSLGNVTVEVTQQQSGSLSVVLSAENNHTRDLLKQHIGGLQDLLSGQNQRSVQVEVTRPQQTQHETPNYDGRNGHENGGQQEHRQKQSQHNTQDFMEQLRLGLIPLDVQTS